MQISRPFRKIADIAAGFNDIVSAIATIAALLGTGSSLGSKSLSGLQVAHLPFALRLVAYLIIAAGLGWALGSLVKLSSRLPTRGMRPIFVALSTLAFAGLVAGAGSWLIGAPSDRDLSRWLNIVMPLLGGCIALRATVHRFSAEFGVVGKSEILFRSNTILLFTISLAIVLGFQELGMT
ncbi:hypothetical protein GCM10010961_33860 [Pseudodonghicola xiamenensis]|uniref:Uncharacterized protein n=2 Tax=Pseudodonghicola xiamenensis TaxID=337702 RepID=A0A8J3HBF7_9RHOB|nr:hypothetical protein GCM10010961_33860 [Pseudodonghicola xiamenensis]